MDTEMINHSLTLAPKAIQIALRRLRHLPDYYRDRQRSTFIDQNVVPHSELALAHYFTLDALLPALAVDRAALAGVAAHFLAHRFDLLGSGWVQVRYGMICRGMGGCRYSAVPPDAIDSMGEWLTARLNRPNVTEAQRIWQLIDREYVPIDWQLDFKTGYRWSEKTWYQAIRYGRPRGVDIKVPWELARMQHLPQLALYAAQNADRRAACAREFRNQTLDFIATNPPRFGVNWSGTMDVAIRVANWLVAYDLFRAQSITFDAPFVCKLTRSIYQHGVHIRANLEWQFGWRGNHYLAALVGLLFVAAYLPNSNKMTAWYSFAARALIRETALQFNADGSTREGSTAYHRLAAEIVLYATHILRARGDLFPAAHIDRLRKMANFTRDLTQPDGHIPQIGDNDNGRFLKLHTTYQQLTVAQAKARYATLDAYADLPDDAPYWDEDHLDHRALIRMLAEYAPPDPLANSPVYTPKTSVHWVERSEVQQIFNAPNAEHGDLRDGLTRHAYPDFGVYVYRSARLYLAIRCGTVGQNGRGGHAHNDQLSITLWLDGAQILSDPGTYCYTPLPDRRNAYRSAAVHNGPRPALIQRDREPGRLDLGLFRLGDRAHAQCVTFDAFEFIGGHSGYAVPVYRRVLIEPNAIVVEDFSTAADVQWLTPQPIALSPGYGSLLR